MAKTKKVTNTFNTSLLIVLLIGIIGGFIGGYVIARERYQDKIAVISEMNMERAVTIDSLHTQIQVLGAKTQAGE